MATTAQYTATPSSTFAALTTANTTLSGLTAATVFVAGASGGRVDTIHIHATSTTTAGMIRLFCGAAADISAALIAEIPVLANTPSATNPAWSANVDLGLIIQANFVLSATTEKAENFDVSVRNGGSF
jgi:hypothetical protein